MTVCEMTEVISAASWSPDGASIVFAAGAPAALYIAAVDGGSPRLLIPPKLPQGEPEQPMPGWITNPWFLPGRGRQTALFVSLGLTPAFNSATIMAIDTKTGSRHVVAPGNYPAYSPTGHLLYRSGSDLWARSFSPDRLQLDGEAFRIARNATDHSVASDGTLVYREVPASQLSWLDRAGSRLGRVGQPADLIFYPALSPDGRRIAAEVAEADHYDIWVSEVLRDSRIRLTSHPATEILPVWSPNGEEVAYGSYRSGNIDIFVRRADASSDERPLAVTAFNERATDWSPQERHILYSLLSPKTGYDLWYLERSAAGAWEPHVLLETRANERGAKFSPDGSYVAYLSDESGRNEVYVRQFPAGDRKWPVSNRGASQIRWSRNSGELFYIEDGRLIAVPVHTWPDLKLGQPTRLFSHPALSGRGEAGFDVSADGQRFILLDSVGTQEQKIHVVQNWFAEFGNRRKTMGHPDLVS